MNNDGIYREMAKTAIYGMQTSYDESKGVYVDGGIALWWITASAIESLLDFMKLTGSFDYLDIVSNTFQHAPKSQGACHFLNDFYDDEAWWAITWIKAYDLTKDKYPSQAAQYLEMARYIFEDLKNGWDAKCGGGTWWSKNFSDPGNTKGAINNELFLVVAARLYERTRDGDFRLWATKEWQWFKQSGLIGGNNLIRNGLTKDTCGINPDIWTYNQGVILGGLVDYNNISGGGLLPKALLIAEAVMKILIYPNQKILREPCETDKKCDGNQERFKGIFMRYLAYLYAATENETWKKKCKSFIKRNADSIWQNNRDGDYFGLYWIGPFDKKSVTRQASALDAFNAAIPFDSI